MYDPFVSGVIKFCLYHAFIKTNVFVEPKCPCIVLQIILYHFRFWEKGRGRRKGKCGVSHDRMWKISGEEIVQWCEGRRYSAAVYVTIY